MMIIYITYRINLQVSVYLKFFSYPQTHGSKTKVQTNRKCFFLSKIGNNYRIHLKIHNTFFTFYLSILYLTKKTEHFLLLHVNNVNKVRIRYLGFSLTNLHFSIQMLVLWGKNRHCLLYFRNIFYLCVCRGI